VPAEEGHSEEGPRVLEWRTLFLGAGREAFAITEDPADPGSLFHWLDNRAEDNVTFLGQALEAMGIASIFQSRLEQFRGDWNELRATLSDAGRMASKVPGLWPTNICSLTRL
jgi:hypothetical protein